MYSEWVCNTWFERQSILVLILTRAVFDAIEWNVQCLFYCFNCILKLKQQTELSKQNPKFIYV